MNNAAVVQQRKSGGAVWFMLFLAALPFLFTMMLALFLFSAPFLALAPPETVGGVSDFVGLPDGPVPTYIPEEIQYRDITPYIPQLVSWLAARNSAMASEEYLQIINRAGQRWNVDPLLLLAIAGQEQSFVPKRGRDWPLIMNNPWNVFHSWMEWQGGFEASANWAANTVARLSKDYPGGVSIICWINGFGPDGTRSNPRWGYAGDPRWWIGVSRFYEGFKNMTGGGG
ncbi:MAG: lytic transglycosylase domain-containing protein [Armatimonadetes bacterium]|nr:lytic transglycosylase domain-containing protein [Armatimonadota bacterium]